MNASNLSRRGALGALATGSVAMTAPAGSVMKITSIEKPDQGATIWSGKAKIGTRNLEWFYWPRVWLHVREQEPHMPRCWMNIETPEGFREEVLRAVRRSKRYPVG